jgi:hypothetical protein
MCDPVTVAFASMQAVGSMQQGNAAKKQANAQAQQDEYQAAIARDAAAMDARNIRRAGRFQRGETLASIAASGVKIGEGSALDAERYVMETSETDAAIAILGGERQGQAFEQQAAQTRAQGRSAQRAGWLNAGTSLLSAGMRSESFRNGVRKKIDGFRAPRAQGQYDGYR